MSNLQIIDGQNITHNLLPYVRAEFSTNIKDLAEARRQQLEQGQTNSKLAKSRIATKVC
jgi:hypothetical protein